MNLYNWILLRLGSLWWPRWITRLQCSHSRGPRWFWVWPCDVRRSLVSVCTAGLVLSKHSLLGRCFLDPAPLLWEAHPGHGERTAGGERRPSPPSSRAPSQQPAPTCHRVSEPSSQWILQTQLSCLFWALPRSRIMTKWGIVLFHENVAVDYQNQLNRKFLFSF